MLARLETACGNGPPHALHVYYGDIRFTVKLLNHSDVKSFKRFLHMHELGGVVPPCIVLAVALQNLSVETYNKQLEYFIETAPRATFGDYWQMALMTTLLVQYGSLFRGMKPWIQVGSQAVEAVCRGKFKDVAT